MDESATDWASIPAYRLSASGWERLPAADALEVEMAQETLDDGDGTPENREPSRPDFSNRAEAEDTERRPLLPRDRKEGPEKRDTGPTVRVKIGRLDVTTPPPVAASAPTPILGPRVALSTYLRRRRASRR